MTVVTFLIGVFWRGHAADDMFMMVVALAASSIPEGLPAIMTITLALGVRRMAGRNAIIRHLPAVETLGSVTVICSDKTGTLTRNEMTVQSVAAGDHTFEVTGGGYAPDGGFHLAGVAVSVDGYPELISASRAALLCNDARLRNHDGDWQVEGDPMEGATISSAVREGRGIYDNIRKFALFMLPTNGGEALVVTAAILFELTLPLTAAQVLWINMVTASTLGLALAFELPKSDVMQRLPRDPREPLLSWFFIWRILMVSVLMMTGALGLFLWELDRGASLESARTMAVSAIVVTEMFYLLNSRHIFRSVLSREELFGNRSVLIVIVVCALLQIAYVHTGPMQVVFHSTYLTFEEWFKVMLVGAFVFAFAEVEKAIIRCFSKNRASAGRSDRSICKRGA